MDVLVAGGEALKEGTARSRKKLGRGCFFGRLSCNDLPVPDGHSSPKQFDSRGLAVAGIGILLVVIGQSTGVMPDRERELAATNGQYAAFIAFVRWIYVFHMPLFFALSGYNMIRFTRSRPGRSLRTFVVDRSRRLLLPYIVISSLAYPVKVILGHFAVHPVQWSVTGYAHTLLYPVDNTIRFFWFLPSLFFSQILCWVFIPRRANIGAELGVVLACLVAYFHFTRAPLRDSLLNFLNVSGILHNMIFVVAGALAAKHSITLNPKWRVYIGFIGLSATILAASLPDSGPLQLVGAFGGIGAVVALAASQAAFANSLVPLGIYSFQVYLLSWFPLIFVRITLGQIIGANIWLVVSCSIVLGLTIPVLMTKWFNARVPAQYRFVYGA